MLDPRQTTREPPRDHRRVRGPPGPRTSRNPARAGRRRSQGLGAPPLGVTLFAGLACESRLGSISIGVDGGTLGLFGMAAAVIGGASLLGGRGKPIPALIGGFVVATVYTDAP